MPTSTETEWQTKVKNILKGELKRNGVSYADLVAKLEVIGIQETERNLANKISRGGFTAAFMVQCFEAIGEREIRL